MPKQKTNSGAKKRFSFTGTGKVKRNHAYHSHILTKKTKGYYGARKNVWTVAKNTYEKGLTYAYRDRRNKKRTFRALWIQRINAAARLYDMSYSQLMGALHKANIEINRKVLADLAANSPEAFKAIVEKVK